MADIRPFRCIHPNEEVAPKVAALPYDVYSRKEAKQVVAENHMSFLAIDRAETQFEEEIDLYDPQVYEKARETLEMWKYQGIFVEDKTESYYIYALTMDGRTQTGIVACASVDDYRNEIIRKHENTREEKEQDRICHVNVTDTHTGPIFLAYRSDEILNRLVKTVCKEKPLYDFTSDDGVRHQVWQVRDEADCAPEIVGGDAGEESGRAGLCAGSITAQIRERFAKMQTLYIADGHHRAASAVKVGLMRRALHPDYTGDEPFNYFLAVLFPDDQLKILPYNRVVMDLNGYTREEFLKEVEKRFDIKSQGRDAFQPTERHHMGMYLDGCWYELTARPQILPSGVDAEDPVKTLDVSILQEGLLGPVLGIRDPRTDERIRFVGGIRGLGELERTVDGVAFSMYPTSIAELFAVADAGRLMPPKSTWFEPKLRSGLFLHKLS